VNVCGGPAAFIHAPADEDEEDSDMNNNKNEQASRPSAADMLKEIEADNELRKGFTDLDKQLDQLRRVIWALEEDQVTVIEASADLDDQLNSIIETSWVVEWTLEDTRALLESLDGKKFTVQLDDQSIETVKGIHGEFFTNEKKLIEEAQEKMEKMLSQHREKLKRIKDGESVWLSFKAWIWAIIVFELLLAAVGFVVYFCAKAKFT
jgi:small-conductance mechanosensitive channel